MELKNKDSQRGSFSFRENASNNQKLYLLLEEPKIIQVLGIIFLSILTIFGTANYREKQAQKTFKQINEAAATLEKIKLDMWELQQNAEIIVIQDYRPNIAANNHVESNLKQFNQKMQRYKHDTSPFAEIDALAPDILPYVPNFDNFTRVNQPKVMAYLQFLDTQATARTKSPILGSASRDNYRQFLLITHKHLMEITGQIDNLSAEMASAQAEAEHQKKAVAAMRLHTSWLLVVVAICIAVVMTIQKRSTTIKFHAYLRQEKALNAQLEADLKHITQAANQVAESGTFDWQLPPLEAAGELGDSLNRLIAQVKQLLQKVESEKEDKIFQTDKMASLGKMVAGVAHEINNPLNCIYGNLDHISNYTKDLLALIHTYQKEIPEPPAAVSAQAEDIELKFIEEDLPQMMEAMQVAAERVREIVITLKNFSRVDEGTAQPVDLHKCLDSTLLILQNRIKHGFQIVRHYGNLPMIEGYPGLLSQVFINLLSNSLDALEEKGPAQGIKEITITTSLLDEDAVEIRIADNGPGISGDARSKMFKTFFTTKPQGVGTGLGLAIVRKIVVEKYGGTISCNSEPDMGTEFAIALPVKQNSASELADNS